MPIYPSNSWRIRERYSSILSISVWLRPMSELDPFRLDAEDDDLVGSLAELLGHVDDPHEVRLMKRLVREHLRAAHLGRA